MMIFNLFTVATITILAPNNRTAALVDFSCQQMKLLKAFV